MSDIKMDLSGLESFTDFLESVTSDNEVKSFKEDAVKSLAQVYLASAKLNTPTKGFIKRKDPKTNRVYTSDSQHMKQRWDVEEVVYEGSDISIPVVNTASYASFVDLGHRQEPGRYIPILGKRLKAGWVEGLHITETAKEDTEQLAPSQLQKAFDKWIGDNND